MRPAATERRTLARAISDLTAGNAVPGLRAVARAGRRRRGRGRRRHAPAQPSARRSSATPESVREVVGRRLAHLRPATATCSSWPPPPAPSSSSTSCARAADAALLAALDEAVRSGMIEELPSRGWPTASRTSSSAARSTTGSRRCAAPSCTCVSARRWSARRAVGPPPRRPRAPLHRRRAVRRRRARRSSTTCSPPARRAAALAFDEAAERLRVALELGIDGPAERGGAAGRAGHGQAPRRPGGRRARGVRARRRRSPARSVTRSCSRAPRSATRTRAGAR